MESHRIRCGFDRLGLTPVSVHWPLGSMLTCVTGLHVPETRGGIASPFLPQTRPRGLPPAEPTSLPQSLRRTTALKTGPIGELNTPPAQNWPWSGSGISDREFCHSSVATATALPDRRRHSFTLHFIKWDVLGEIESINSFSTYHYRLVIVPYAVSGRSIVLHVRILL